MVLKKIVGALDWSLVVSRMTRNNLWMASPGKLGLDGCNSFQSQMDEHIQWLTTQQSAPNSLVSENHSPVPSVHGECLLQHESI